MNNITIVTAFFDIGRGNLPISKHGRHIPKYQHRTIDEYFEFFANLAKIENDMIVYTTPDLKDRVLNVRQGRNTKIVCLDSYLPDGFKEIKEEIKNIMESPEYYGKVHNPHLIEYWHVDYVLVNIFKSYYVSHAIDSDLIDTDLVAWIDFGYCRNNHTVTEKWNYDFDKDKIHFFIIQEIDKDRPIDSIIYTGDVYTMGCHIVAGKSQWHYLKDSMIYNLKKLINNKLIDDDQTLMLMSYLDHPDNFILRSVDPIDWFIIFRNYNEN
jgi:protein YibB